MTPDQHPRPSEAVPLHHDPYEAWEWQWTETSNVRHLTHKAIPTDPDSLTALHAKAFLTIWTAAAGQWTRERCNQIADAVLAEILGDVEKETGA